VCDGAASCVALVVSGDGAVREIDQLRVSARGAILAVDAPSPPEPLSSPLRLPVQLALLGVAHASGALSVHVEGRLASTTVGAGDGSGVMGAGTIAVTLHSVDATGVDLGSAGGTAPDGASAFDAAGDASPGISLDGGGRAADDLANLDLANPDGFAPCDTVAQTGCGPGEKCRLGNGGSVCDVAGTLAIGQVCTLRSDGSDDCVRGGFCLASDFPRHSAGQCSRFCSADPGCTSFSIAGDPSVCVENVCSNPCNPVAALGATGCPGTDLSCVVLRNSGSQIALCGSFFGTLPEGATCSTGSVGDCQNNLSCVGGKCRRACREGVTADCGAAAFCASSGGPTWGFCCPTAGC
jgi:hypothetical protein